MKHLVIALIGMLSVAVVTPYSRAWPHDLRLSRAVPVETTLVRKEKAVWDANRHRDVRALSDLLADETYAVETDGRVSDKRQQLADLATLSIAEVRMDSIHVSLVDANVGIVRYRVMVTGASNKAPTTPAWSQVSAVWLLRRGEWRCVAYHATHIK